MKHFKFLAIFAALLSPFLLQSSYEAGQINFNQQISLQLEPMATVITTGAHYQTSRSFISEIYEVPASDTFSLNWMEEISHETAAEIEMRFRNTNGVWTDWEHMHKDEHSGPRSDNAEWSFLFADELSDAFQYRVGLNTENSAQTPKIKLISLNYDSTEEQVQPLEGFTALFKKTSSKIIPREDWILNESAAYFDDDYSYEEEENEEDQVDWYDEENAKVIDVSYKDSDGNYIWPLQYQDEDDLKKIVVHHTASTKYLSDSKRAGRAIYNYHAGTRGWGDIGYHYLIGTDGKILEGRKGGPEVIGGHTGGYNGGTIGIALLGDYHTEDSMPGKMAESLANLIYDLSEDYEIDPGKTSKFRGEKSSNLLGHRDLTATACPGNYTHDYLDEMGDFVSELLDEDDYNDVSSQFDYMEADDKKTVSFSLTNYSKSTWNSPKLKLKNKNKLVDLSVSSSPSSIAAGKSGLFKLSLKSDDDGGFAELDLEISVAGKEVAEVTYGVYIEEEIEVEEKSKSSSNDAKILEHSEDSPMSPGETRLMWIQIKNTGNTKWSKDSFDLQYKGDDELEADDTRLVLKNVNKNVSTKVFFNVTAPDEPGEYTLEVWPLNKKKKLTKSAYKIDIEVEETNLTTVSKDAIRIKLTPDNGVGEPLIGSREKFAIYDDQTLLKTFAGNSRVRITEPEPGKFYLRSGGDKWTVNGPLRFVPENEAAIRVYTMDQRPAWNTSLNDNEFLGIIELAFVSGEMTLINELDLQDYLKGVAEISGDTHSEKAKVMSILARSYAHYYMTVDQKFPGKPYHLEDDPDTSQKYLGHNFTKRSEDIIDAVEATEDLVVTYKGEVVKTPYFSQSNGVATKSAQEVWGWTHTPFLVSVSDTHCAADSFWGHGVGLSGCGAEALAQKGKSFEEIIKYYYSGVEVEEL
ncbi:hypothetical protein HOD30_05240 [Candidatus Peregrinibacteria bacterium]|jgi:hypothetical protein|nr:hypothetical protein [Candidatus Peregrinibacteria bacterium]MBT4631426.1 hypothetical protein [Candidatus Peregrinibacteria bacterium]MBT5516935.1 hypothetical protein [Candidatus Peregrinibacteria bacterium]MBT5823989.1 hypothetical protein [Candidatus Peregrinibacteria bacterium]